MSDILSRDELRQAYLDAKGNFTDCLRAVERAVVAKLAAIGERALMEARREGWNESRKWHWALRYADEATPEGDAERDRRYPLPPVPLPEYVRPSDGFTYRITDGKWQYFDTTYAKWREMWGNPEPSSLTIVDARALVAFLDSLEAK